MARISDRLIVQLADDQVVIMDESTGNEVAFPIELAPAVSLTLNYFTEQVGV